MGITLPGRVDAQRWQPPSPEDAAKYRGIAEITGSWLRHLVTRDGASLKNDSAAGIDGLPPQEEQVDLEKANLITSRFKGEGIETHALLLDLDVEHTYFPSTQPGHGHLLVNVKLSRHQWEMTMQTLAKIGLIEAGYDSASRSRGYASLRLPWIKKEKIA